MWFKFNLIASISNNLLPFYYIIFIIITGVFITELLFYFDFYWFIFILNAHFQPFNTKFLLKLKKKKKKTRIEYLVTTPSSNYWYEAQDGVALFRHGFKWTSYLDHIVKIRWVWRQIRAVCPGPNRNYNLFSFFFFHRSLLEWGFLDLTCIWCDDAILFT